MGLPERILGYMTAPFVGERHVKDNYRTPANSGTEDAVQEKRTYKYYFGAAHPQRMVPYHQIQQPGDTLFNRAYGTHTLIPGRALSAQTRLKNLYYEIPAAIWTRNPEGDPYIVRVPGLPQKISNISNIWGANTQPIYLQPITNLQIENDVSLMAQFRAKIFGDAQQQHVVASQQEMFPSIYSNAWE